MSFYLKYEVRPCLYHTNRLILGCPFAKETSCIIVMGVSIVTIDASLLHPDGYHRVIRSFEQKPSVVSSCQDGSQCTKGKGDIPKPLSSNILRGSIGNFCRHIMHSHPLISLLSKIYKYIVYVHWLLCFALISV